MLAQMKTKAFHVGVLWLLAFVTNCRYVHEGARDPEMAVFPIIVSVTGLVLGACAARGARWRALSLGTLFVLMSGVACFIVALVHLHHLLPCTLFSLNGMVFLSVAHELWDALHGEDGPHSTV